MWVAGILEIHTHVSQHVLFIKFLPPSQTTYYFRMVISYQLASTHTLDPYSFHVYHRDLSWIEEKKKKEKKKGQEISMRLPMTCLSNKQLV